MTDQTTAMRQWLASETKAVHEALHVHPLLGSLVLDSVSEAQYHAALFTFHTVFSEIEKQRIAQNAFPEFNLSREITALERDIGRTAFAELPHSSLDLPDRAAVLGALYTAHGSAFGSAAIGQRLALSLPNTERHFHRLRPMRDRWRALIRALEIHADNRASLALGASRAFADVECVATAALRQCTVTQLAVSLE